MESIVKIHNAVNERTWTEIMKWESEFHWFGSRFNLMQRYLISFDQRTAYLVIVEM